MKDYENLNAELIRYIENEDDKTPVEINNHYYGKLFLSNDVLLIVEYKNFLDTFHIKNTLCINIKKKCILHVFSDGFELLKNPSKEIQECKLKNLFYDFENAIKEEFLAVIENLEFDEILLKDTEVIKRAKEQGCEKLNYEIPNLDILDNLNVFAFSEILKDVNDAAYSYLEKYLMKNPAYLRECQKIFAINKLIEERRNSLGIVSEVGIEDIRKTISNILLCHFNHSVQIVFETNTGEDYTSTLYVTSEKILGLPPFYAIKKIIWRKNVLYERVLDEKLIDIYRNDIDINLEFLERYKYYKQNFDLSSTKLFSKELFKSHAFMISYAKVIFDKKDFLPIIDKSLLGNLDFALDFIATVSEYDRIDYSYIYQTFSKLQREEQFCLSFFDKRFGYEVYKNFVIEMKQNKNVLKKFIESVLADARTGALKTTIYNNLTSEVLDGDDLVNYVETLLLPHSLATYHLDVAKRYKDKEFLYRICVLEQKIPKEFQDGTVTILDDEFMRGLIHRTDVSYDFILNKLETSFKHLLMEQDIQQEILCKLNRSQILKVNKLLKIAPDLLSLDNMKKALNVLPNHVLGSLLYFSDKDVKIECLKLKPNCLKYAITLNNKIKESDLTKEIFEILDELVLLNENNLQYFAQMYYLNESLVMMLTRYPAMLKYLNYCSDINIRTLKDKAFILPYMNSKNVNYDIFIFNRDFVREQAKLNPLVLKHLNTPRKNSSLKSLHSDRDFVLELIHFEPKNIYGLWKKSPFFDDVSFAKEVLSLIPEAKKLFTKRVRQEIEI